MACLATTEEGRSGNCSTHVPNKGLVVVSAATASVVKASPTGRGQYR